MNDNDKSALLNLSMTQYLSKLPKSILSVMPPKEIAEVIDIGSYFNSVLPYAGTQFFNLLTKGVMGGLNMVTSPDEQKSSSVPEMYVNAFKEGFFNPENVAGTMGREYATHYPKLPPWLAGTLGAAGEYGAFMLPFEAARITVPLPKTLSNESGFARVGKGEEVPFISKLEQEISNAPMEKFTPEQISGYLKGKVKNLELENRFPVFTDLNKTMTKAELLKSLKEAPQVEEMVKGQSERRDLHIQKQPGNDFLYDVVDDTGKKLVTNLSQDAASQAVDTYWEGKGETKFSQYQLPGGENYREVLFKAPIKSKMALLDSNGNIKSWLDEKPTQLELNVWKKRGLYVKELPLDEGSAIFKSPHWDEPNVLSHARINDRITPDGKKIMFIEEIQSDWAKEAREYAGKLKPETPDEAELGVGTKILSHSLLKNWQEFTLKRLIKKAIDEGYDGISWTTGEQQAVRYDLSKQISKVTASKGSIYGAKKGEVGLYIVDKNNGEYFNSIIPEKEVEKWVGKDLAEKIHKQEGQVEYTGLDLKIGGEWAKNLYDRQIPNILKDLTKGDISTIRVPHTKSKTAKAIYKEGLKPLVETTQPALMLTPDIVSALKKGLPLFSITGLLAKDNKE